MNRRALIVFVILNIAVSVGVALLVIAFWQSNLVSAPDEPIVQVFEVIITATPGPTQTPWIVTVVGNETPDFSAIQAGEPTVAPTLNPDILPAIATSAALTQVAVRSSGGQEQTYTVVSGDSPSTIAQRFEVDLDDLLCANDLGTVDNPEYIYPGQVLIIPGADFVCGLALIPTEAPTTVATTAGSSTVAGALATPVPTVTLAPTAENAQVVIAQVVGANDVTREEVFINNLGGLVDLRGWTLYDTEGNIYTFPEYRLFPGAGVRVFTRIGEDTPVALFWGQTQAVWQPGDVISLANASGVVQSTLRVP